MVTCQPHTRWNSNKSFVSVWLLFFFLSFFFPFSCATKGLYKNISLKSQNRQDYYPPVGKWAHVTPSKVVPRKDQRQNPRKRRKSSLVKPRIECSCSILSRGYCVLGYQQTVTEILQNVGGITFDGWLLIRGKLEWSQSLLHELSQLILANLISGIVRIMLYHLSYLSCFREERHNACDRVG